jgi:7,8-dihydropterin-6-yl-methyl-4-(beta-D-ribofuranosyl)aminobenzene 5'-phosphate synthase
METPLSFDIKIVFDDKCPRPGFLTGFGFSALIFNHFTGSFSLFDTGGKSNVLIHNINQFKIDIFDIKNIVISHNHYDHAGGLKGILQKNPNINVYVPMNDSKSFSKKFPAKNIQGVTQMIEIEKNFLVSGQLDNYISEQSVFLKTKERKLIILVGCAHPGLEKFIIKANEITKIKAIIGGFHGFKKFSYLNDIELIGACHCSRYINSIKKSFPNQFKQICVGDTYLF